MLSAFAAAGVFFIYVYHITFFLGVMACAAHMEMSGDESMFAIPCTVTSKEEQDKDAEAKPDGKNKVTESVADNYWPSILFTKIYRPIVGTWQFLLVTVHIFALYVGLASWGVTLAKEGLEPASMVLPDDPFIKHTDIMADTYWKAGMQMSILVNNAPNLALIDQRRIIDNLTEDFKQFEFAYKNNDFESTIFFLRCVDEFWFGSGFHVPRDYDTWTPQKQTRWYYKGVHSYLSNSGGQFQWSLDVHWKTASKINDDRYHVGFGFVTDPTEEFEEMFDQTKNEQGNEPTDVWNAMFSLICANETLRKTADIETFLFDDRCQEMLFSSNDHPAHNMTDAHDDWLNFWLERRDYPVIDAFRFYLVLANFTTSTKHKDAMVGAREIADRYPTLNVTTYNEYYVFSDQYLHVWPTTMQNMLIALICMMTVSILMIPDPLCAVLCVINIVSIDLGLFGFMFLWGVRLDCISMITIIMSVGFAVDLTAHICYAYVIAVDARQKRKTAQPKVHPAAGGIEMAQSFKNGKTEKKLDDNANEVEDDDDNKEHSNDDGEKQLPQKDNSDNVKIPKTVPDQGNETHRDANTEAVVEAMAHLGWPVVQGAVSTIIGMLILFTIKAYSIQTFFKSVTLVCFFGLIHSVLFLPVLLIWWSRLRDFVVDSLQKWRKHFNQ